MQSATATAIPVLQTERLVLRGHSPADFDDCAAMWADPRVVRHIGGRPFSGEEVWALVLRYAGLWTLLGYGYWVVRERGSGEFVGEVGFADFRREVAPPLGELPEAGWIMAARAQGRGFATEAVTAALRWADAHLAAPGTICMIDLGNAASIRVAAKLGYRERGRALYKGEETMVYERPRP